MFPFQQDEGALKRLAEDWSITAHTRLAIKGPLTAMELARPSGPVRPSGLLRDRPRRPHGLEGSVGGIHLFKSDPADSRVVGSLHILRLPGSQADGRWREEIAFGNRLAQGEQTLEKTWTAF